ncbi:hypothetical protein CTA2_3805 [Colletotrichum tanaceti]|uniref:Uncharacterized protein n=1 Tax=Colletotrichum tanaceti TaxID=1306861 RepID=A0A4U6X682_9PEZI|nr:hypothetical protein CTA2_3805 [Colletotrichum tanaceti]TKW50513.1 hypothetical protein CTA1_12566 [Colletotrichum tanaceti]
MDTFHVTQGLWGDTGSVLNAPVNPIFYFFAALLAAFFIYSLQGFKINHPSANQKKFFELTNSQPRKYYLANARTITAQCFSANPNKPMKIDLGQRHRRVDCAAVTHGQQDSQQ